MFQRYHISQKSAWLASILVLFVLASGIIGYQIRTQSQQEVAPVVAQTTIPMVEPVVEPSESVSTVAPVPEPEAPVLPEATAPITVDVASFLEPAVQTVVYPLEGAVISVFSVSELTYNETLGDWRIHDGVDIAAPLGTAVSAACSGTVILVEDHDLMGTQVVIDHNNGYQTTYANLQTDPMVTQGDVVSSGQMIATVGTTALMDSALEPHLHFSVSYNGDLVDPMEYLNP